VSDPVKGVVALARRAEGELPSGLGVRALASLVAGNHGARGGIVWAQGAGGPGVGGAAPCAAFDRLSGSRKENESCSIWGLEQG
jgi:hypothetical protein